MDVESDEEDEANSKKSKENVNKNKDAMPPPLPPLPSQMDNIVIRKDYNPKAFKAPTTQSNAQANPPSKSADSWVISPITGEKIPAGKIDEHMRYGLLDPRWVEQRERALQGKGQQEEVYAQGSAIESSLKQLAERRTDIFGSGDEETAIGKKIGEEERKKPEKVTWDGYTASMEAATRAARANITIEEQIQQIHKMKGLVPDEVKDRIGPAVFPTSQPNQTSSQSQIVVSSVNNKPPEPPPISVMPVMSTIPSVNLNRSQPSAQGLMPTQVTNPQPILMTPNPQATATPFMMTPTPLMMRMYAMTTLPPGHDLAQNSATAALHNPNAALSMGMNLASEEEPAFKKQRTEDNLIPEEEFLLQHSGPVTFQVNTPNISDKPEWKLQGQTIDLTLHVTDQVSVIKAKIHEEIGMPPGKQKLQYEGIFIKDSNTLAYYNIGNGATIVLGLKERGGRKK